MKFKQRKRAFVKERTSVVLELCGLTLVVASLVFGWLDWQDLGSIAWAIGLAFGVTGRFLL